MKTKLEDLSIADLMATWQFANIRLSGCDTRMMFSLDENPKELRDQIDYWREVKDSVDILLEARIKATQL